MIHKMGRLIPKIGRIILEGCEVEPYVLYDVDHAVMFEIVDGQYRIERIQDEASTERLSSRQWVLREAYKFADKMKTGIGEGRLNEAEQNDGGAE